MAPIGIGQLLAPGAIGPAQTDRTCCRSCWPSRTPGCWPRPSRTSSCSTAFGCSGPTRVITLQSLVPAMAVVLAAIFLSEPIRPVQVVGGAIIILGVALTRLRVPRPPAVRR